MTFAACHQRPSLRSFLWLQPLLLLPQLLEGRQQCAAQLAGSGEAAEQLSSVAAALRRSSAWLPMGAAALTAATVEEQQQEQQQERLCRVLHTWLLACLAYLLPAILLHVAEARTLHLRLPAGWRKALDGTAVAALATTPSGEALPAAGGAAAAAASPAEAATAAADSGSDYCEDLLQPDPGALLVLFAELALAAYVAWMLVLLLMV